MRAASKPIITIPLILKLRLIVVLVYLSNNGFRVA
jgi:hypothetical protein